MNTSILPQQKRPTSPGVIDLYNRFGESPEKLLALFNADMQKLYCKDLRRVYRGISPILGIVKAAYGENVAEAWLMIQLEDLSEFSGCKDKLHQRQLEQLAYIILDTYADWKLTEFMHFCQTFKKGKYGVFYGSIDPLTITTALQKFSEERERLHTKFEDEELREKRDKEYSNQEYLWKRYVNRIPNAGSDKALINFHQYRLMGFNQMTDQELLETLEKIERGEMVLPKSIYEMLNLPKC